MSSFVTSSGSNAFIASVPPFVTVDGLTSRVVGINRVGLRRSGFTSAQISRFKDVYNVVYRQGLSWKEVLETLRTQFNQGEEALVYEMLSASTRGIIQARIQPSLKVNIGDSEQESTDDNAAA